MDTPNKQSFEAKHKAALNNVHKTVTGYKKAQSDDKELGAQLKLLTTLNSLWEMQDGVELELSHQGQLLVNGALGYKALGLDRDAQVIANQFLALEPQLVEEASSLTGTKGTKAQASVKSMVDEIKALNRSCSRRPFDLSVRTICVDLFIHVKSFIDYFTSLAPKFHAQIVAAYEQDNGVDNAALLELNRIFKLLKINASCSLTLSADVNNQVKPLLTLNPVADDEELACIYAAFFTALKGYGTALQEHFSFDIERALCAQASWYNNTCAPESVALHLAYELLEHNAHLCPAFLQDSEAFAGNSRKLNLEALSASALQCASTCDSASADPNLDSTVETQEVATPVQDNNAEDSIAKQPSTLNVNSCSISATYQAQSAASAPSVSETKTISAPQAPEQAETKEEQDVLVETTSEVAPVEHIAPESVPEMALEAETKDEIPADSEAASTKSANEDHIVASNAYQMPQENEKTGGFFGFVRRLFGGK